MSYTKYVYNRINWKNKTESLDTPLGATNLNQMDSAIYNIAENLDIVYNEMTVGKFDEANADKVIVGLPAWNSETGVLTFQFYDGTEFSVDFNIEKIPVSFSMDSAGVITMTTADGTQWTADIGNAIPDYTFDDSDRIAFVRTKNVDGSFSIKADLIKSSITDEYLQPNYLANIMAQTSSSAASAKSASDFADNAAFDAKLSQSYAVGGSGIRDGEETDNAKASKEAAQAAAEAAQDALENMQAAQVTGVKGDEEEEYRQGLVNITPENIGLEKVDNIADAEKNVNSASKWTTARNFNISDYDAINIGDKVSVNGSADATLKLPAKIKADIIGNADASIKSTQDEYGNNIFSTYAKVAHIVSGSVSITVSKGALVILTFGGSRYVYVVTQTNSQLTITQLTSSSINYGISTSGTTLTVSGSPAVVFYC